MNKKYLQFYMLLTLIIAFAFMFGQMSPEQAYSASPMVDDIIIIPRNYIFTWGSSGQSIGPNNTVYCSSIRITHELYIGVQVIQIHPQG